MAFCPKAMLRKEHALYSLDYGPLTQATINALPLCAYFYSAVPDTAAGRVGTVPPGEGWTVAHPVSRGRLRWKEPWWRPRCLKLSLPAIETGPGTAAVCCNLQS